MRNSIPSTAVGFRLVRPIRYHALLVGDYELGRGRPRPGRRAPGPAPVLPRVRRSSSGFCSQAKRGGYAAGTIGVRAATSRPRSLRKSRRLEAPGRPFANESWGDHHRLRPAVGSLPAPRGWPRRGAPPTSSTRAGLDRHEASGLLEERREPGHQEERRLVAGLSGDAPPPRSAGPRPTSAPP